MAASSETSATGEPTLAVAAMLTAARAQHYARVALANVTRAYPHKIDHLVTGPGEALDHRVMHPAFYGSYDWHSSVHMHWLMVRLSALFGDEPWVAELHEALDRQLHADSLAAELAYFRTRASAGFERPYGWAWLLALHAEARRLSMREDRAVPWTRAVTPLAEHIKALLAGYLARADYPVRSGTHGNTAFALLLARESLVADDLGLRERIDARARAWFLADHDYPARFEPSGEDFLSPGLTVAALMHEVLDVAAFTSWWDAYAGHGTVLADWSHPVTCGAREDARMTHLDGLNLSRAWCFRRIRSALPESQQAVLESAVANHLAASLAAADDGDYVATHWLASFAVLALADTGRAGSEPL